MIGVDMALLAGKGKVTNVGLLTGDSDYIPSVEAVNFCPGPVFITSSANHRPAADQDIR
jgi:hypothetical protein